MRTSPALLAALPLAWLACSQRLGDEELAQQVLGMSKRSWPLGPPY